MEDHILDIIKHHVPGFIGENELKQYAVILPLQLINGEWHIILEKRAADMTVQPGEISLPGGGVEAGDASPRMAAVREIGEELGIAAQELHIIGTLDLFIFPFNLIIYPFVAVLDEHAAFKLNQAEVEKCLVVPLQELKEQTPLAAEIILKVIPPPGYPFHLIPQGKDYPFRAGRLHHYFYEYDGEIIWGITARILLNFFAIINSATAPDKITE